MFGPLPIGSSIGAINGALAARKLDNGATYYQKAFAAAAAANPTADARIFLTDGDPTDSGNGWQGGPKTYTVGLGLRAGGTGENLLKGIAIGLVVAVGFILLGNHMEGGHLSAILQPTAAMIVFGGTLGAVMINFPMEVCIRSMKSVGDLFLNKDQGGAGRTLASSSPLRAPPGWRRRAGGAPLGVPRPPRPSARRRAAAASPWPTAATISS